MHADIERLIALQSIDTACHDAERALAAESDQTRALEERLEAARQQVSTAKDHLAKNQAARRELDKNVAVHQGRLSKFREQAMAVKTNQEYHAIQHEISFAQGEVKKIEDEQLELMMAADELAAVAKKAEGHLSVETKAVEAEKQALAKANTERRAHIEALKQRRVAVAGDIPAAALSLYELVAKRRSGLALAPARDGICTICHVRLRPQVFNTVLRNSEILQCDSCQRILYFVAPAPTGAADTVVDRA